MKRSRRKAIQTFFEAKTTVEGKLTFQGTCSLNGRFSGSVESKGGTMIVGEKGVVDADMSVHTAMVYGQVRGNIRAAGRIELHPPAQVFGDLKAPEILIDTGVVYNGKCKTTSADDSASKTVELHRKP